jgi:hypothetical protein
MAKFKDFGGLLIGAIELERSDFLVSVFFNAER